MVACAAGDVLVPAQNLVVEKELTQPRLIGIEGDEILGADRLGHGRCGQRQRDEQTKMKLTHWMFACCLLATPVLADIEDARDLMEEGRFEEAYDALWPAARSGNAEAEELIGVMYALGLGVDQDYVRAFDWYLRSAMKGHAGAQSGVGWYYETGLGLPATDLVRAFLWYQLSTIGGDPDAAISVEEVVKKMTPDQIEHAQQLVDDYRVWLYPFR
jgi:TPR repeat protein